MMSKYGDGDGNLYALDKYLDKQDKRDESWEVITKALGNLVEESVESFKIAMDEFHQAKDRISSELDDHGMDNSEEVIMQMMYDCGDNDLLEQMNNIDW